MASRSSAHSALGKAVRQGRDERGLTQEQLAQATGLQPTYISDIERGVRNPSWDVVVRLAAALGQKPSALIAKGER